jgi:LPS-assembly protein
VRPTRLRLLPLCLAIAGAVHAQETPKPTWALCHAPATLPWFVDPAGMQGGDRLQAPTDIAADDLDVLKAESTVFSGNVVLTHADQWMATDRLTYLHAEERFSTEGEARYQDRTLRFTADKVEGDQKTDELTLQGVDYQFNEELGNGSAGTAVMKGPVGTLSTATYSTCPPGERQWEFSAGRIAINDETHTGVARNVTLKLGGIPVLWLPVISFPTDDKRRTGLLAPTLGRDDRNGLDVRLPVYLNLAPNYDATMTPRWLSKRGLMLGGEFRYLTERSRGRVEATWLPTDQLDGQPTSGDDRSFLGWRHNTVLNRHWYLDADLNNVSDKWYLSDFGDSIDATSISLVASRAGLYGRGKFWSASLSAESWQIASPLLNDGDEPYRRLPRLQASAWRPLARWFEAGLSLEAVRFSHERFAEVPPELAQFAKYDGGNRLDVQPWIRFPFGGSAWFVTPQLAWRYTRYDGLDGQPVDEFGAPASVTRSLPIASLDAGAYFEREFQWHGGDYVQTLEPRLYYLRVPYRDQDELPLFDTRELTFGWTSLFRDNRFGGADRQSDANQVALALTTRVLGAADGRERLAVGIGRITYFDPPRVRLTPASPFPPEDGSAWVANVDLSVSDWWSLGVTHQWDPDGERTDLSSVRTQLRLHQGTIVNAAYRYRRDAIAQPGLEQTDLSFVIPVNRNWNLYGRWNYSLRDNQTIEALAGFEWNSCCVAVRVLGRQYIRSFDSRENFGLYLEIELNGLGSFGRDTARLLDDAILGYAR